MARMKPRAGNSVVLFDVYYDDGARTSNRKVPATELGGLDGDAPARSFIEAQDEKIAERSGLARRQIVKIVRSAG